jgi:hypothetical protein
MGKASRLKRQRKELRDDARQAMAARLSSRFGDGSSEIPLRAPLPGQPRVSDSLQQLLDPYFDENTTGEAFRRMVVLGMLAWNRAALPEERGQEMIREMRQHFPAEDEKTFVELMEDLSRRKRQLFPDDHRLIVDVEARKEPDGTFYITAASGIPDR